MNTTAYTPKVNDYVLWDKGKFSVEGWVYFKDSSYITIEIGVKCKDEEDIVNCPIHEKTHNLVVCYPESWHQLKYVKTRNNIYDEK
jgi:hypothetical protein